MQIKQAGSDFVDAIKLTADAETMDDLEMASMFLARFVAVVGVAVVMALIFKGAKRVAPRVRAAVIGVAARRLGGITPNHFNLFRQVAQESERIIAVRNTNIKSTPWIERGFPAKPMSIKLHTSAETGIVTAVDSAEMQAARSKGFFVIDEDMVPRNATGQELKLPGKPEWPMEPGQVIDPKMSKPLVGDYDLLGVINPAAKGRNLVLAASEGERVPDWTNPETRSVADQLNARMDQPRVMHGAQDGFDVLPDKGGSVVFFPDGSVKTLDTPEEVAAFYELLGRQTIKGKY